MVGSLQEIAIALDRYVPAPYYRFKLYVSLKLLHSRHFTESWSSSSYRHWDLRRHLVGVHTTRHLLSFADVKLQRAAETTTLHTYERTNATSAVRTESKAEKSLKLNLSWLEVSPCSRSCPNSREGKITASCNSQFYFSAISKGEVQLIQQNSIVLIFSGIWPSTETAVDASLT